MSSIQILSYTAQKVCKNIKMSAQFISRNPLVFFAREAGNHTSNKNKLVNNFGQVWENYKNFRNFMINNCFS